MSGARVLSLLVVLLAAGGCGRPNATDPATAPDGRDTTHAGQPDAAGSPIRVKDGQPVLVRKAKPVLPAGSYILDTPDGMFLHAKYVRFVPEGGQEWEFEFRPTGADTFQLPHGPSDKSGSKFLLTSDTTGQPFEPDKPVFPNLSYEVVDRQGKKVFQWQGKKK